MDGWDLLLGDVVPPHLRQLAAHRLQPVEPEVVQADVAPVVLELASGGVGGAGLCGVELCGASRGMTGQGRGRGQDRQLEVARAHK